MCLFLFSLMKDKINSKLGIKVSSGYSFRITHLSGRFAISEDSCASITSDMSLTL